MNEASVSPTSRLARRIWPRRNELMRRADWVQAALLLAALTVGLVLLPVALTLGSESYARLSGLSAEQSRSRHPATAILDADAPPSIGDVSGRGYAVPAKASSAVRAHWELPDGRTRMGTVPASAGLRAGAAVPIWVDQDGNAVERPISPGNATVSGFTIATAVWVAGCLVLAGIYFAVRTGLNWHRSSTWARDWARVEPDWSRRGR